MELYAHQQEILDRFPKKHLIAFGTGTGKTLTAIELAKKADVKTLIVVPKALKKNWERACQDNELFDVEIVTKEEFRRDWDTLPHFSAIIIDEFHFFANLKSQLSKALGKYKKKHEVHYVWGLTATPFLSTPMNIYALAKHLDHHWNYWSFFYEFFDQIRMGHRMVPKAKTGKEEDLARYVKRIGTTAKLEDLIDVPEQIEEVEYFELSKGQEKAIKDIDETEFISRWTKKHQIEQGVLYGNEYEDFDVKHFESYKNERIKNIVLENDKVAIFCRYNGQIDYLKEELTSFGKPIHIIRGDVKDRDAVVQEVEGLERCIVLINSACSEGYELPSIGVIIFASLSFSYKDFVQSKGRFLRINKPKKNVYTILVTEGVDKDVYNSIRRKEDFSIAIYDSN